jgi:hypothetical protein
MVEKYEEAKEAQKERYMLLLGRIGSPPWGRNRRGLLHGLHSRPIIN